MKHIRIGTRGSKLALWQANFIAGKLLAQGWNTEIVTIDTRGDKILDVSIAKIGSKGVFTEEIEDQLRQGEIDIAVHSAKDLQSNLPEDMEIIAFTERENPIDVLVSDQNIDIRSSLTIGTSSTRRVAMLKEFFPHLQIVPIRGNLQTRMARMREGKCDALMLAYAGVHRMGYEDLIQYEFDKDQFTPPVGQGIVAVESVISLDEEIKFAVRDYVNDIPTERLARTERAFLRRLEGGCSIPAYCHAQYRADTLSVSAGLSALDGSYAIRKQQECSFEEGEQVGDQLALAILQEGGKELLKKIKDSI